MDPVEEFIDEIHTELCRFSRVSNVQLKLGCQQPMRPTAGARAIYYTIGGAARHEHHGVPCVSWVEVGGKTDPISETNVENRAVFADVVRLRVLVMAANKEGARKLFMNLRNAALRTCGSQMVWGNYTAPSEELHSKNATVWAIEADADLTLSVPKNPQQLPGFPEPIADYVSRKVTRVIDQTLDEME